VEAESTVCPKSPTRLRIRLMERGREKSREGENDEEDRMP
jgi:hypothetical protein